MFHCSSVAAIGQRLKVFLLEIQARKPQMKGINWVLIEYERNLS